MTMQFENEAIFEAPLAHDSGLAREGLEAVLETAAAPGFSGEMAPGTHESGAAPGEWTPEAAYEDETGSYEDGSSGAAGPQEAGPFEWSPELGFETGGHEWSPEMALEDGGYEGETDEAGPFEWSAETLDETPYAGERESLAALGLGEVGLEWSGELGSYEADQFLGILRAVRRQLPRLLPVARRLLPGAMGALAGLVPGGGLLKGALGAVLPRLLNEGEGEVAALESQLLGSQESLGEVAPTERAHELALTEVLANEAVLAESQDEASSILATTLPITITIMGGRRTLRPVLPAYVQAHRRLVTVLRQDPSRQLLRAIPAIDRRAVWLLRRWERMGRPITGPVAVNALAAAARALLGDPRRLRPVLLRSSAVRLRTGPRGARRLQTYRPYGAVPRPAARGAFGGAGNPYRPAGAVRPRRGY